MQASGRKSLQGMLWRICSAKPLTAPNSQVRITNSAEATIPVTLLMLTMTLVIPGCILAWDQWGRGSMMRFCGRGSMMRFPSYFNGVVPLLEDKWVRARDWPRGKSLRCDWEDMGRKTYCEYRGNSGKWVCYICLVNVMRNWSWLVIIYLRTNAHKIHNLELRVLWNFKISQDLGRAAVVTFAWQVSKGSFRRYSILSELILIFCVMKLPL